jgi:hypothetical protein
MTNPMTNPEYPKKRRGCFFYGCITCLVLFLVVALMAVLAVRYVASQLNAAIAEYTDTSPMTLPKVDMPADEVKKLQERVDAFGRAYEAHTNAPPLVLTGREINALLANSTNELKNYVSVSLEGSEIKGQISLPLEKYFKIWMIHTQGRYLNGAATMTVGLTNSTLSVMLDSLEVKGKPMPEKFMAGLRGQNMAANANNDPKESAFISRFESILVTNGTIILKAKENVQPAAVTN